MTLIFHHPAVKQRSLASLSVLVLVSLLLGACETTGFAGLTGSGEQRAERMGAAGQHSESAGAYIGL
ncbi:MAG TPA: hypothetical protein PKH39_12680, partial [Woeseiaceae bacterium]|nr:hypothetical protein [Woeseiaceae bacterium]